MSNAKPMEAMAQMSHAADDRGEKYLANDHSGDSLCVQSGEAEQRQADLVERGRAAAGDDEILPERNRPTGGVGDPGTPGRDRPGPR